MFNSWFQLKYLLTRAFSRAITKDTSSIYIFHRGLKEEYGKEYTRSIRLILGVLVLISTIITLLCYL